MIGSARSSGQDQSGQPKGALQPATQAPNPQLWKMTVGGTRRFPVVSPHKRLPVLNLGRPSVAGPIVGIQGLPGSRPQGSGHAFPREALPKWTPYRAAPGGPRLRVSLSCVVSQPGGIRLRLPSRRPIRRRQMPPADAPGRTSPSGWARFQGQRRVPCPAPSGAAAATQWRTTWAQARTRAHKSVKGRPPGRGRTQVAPPVSAALLLLSNSGSPPAQRATAPPAGRAAASSQPRTARIARGRTPGGQDRTPAVPPSTAVAALRSEYRTARLSASRHRCKVGPSGADPSSVRHARLRGHTP
ncbi:hypothetical protein NDU88_004382 [Pleurodeles waltl]|uniref:Uncharacterized protein n=1 Tax=Pleurodeles waltl TaxID=8319 RepID=A0AAV7L8M5_PLEWA|nr:hypothetical protein NDU88_004382 [Pleurodeles waltl]